MVGCYTVDYLWASGRDIQLKIHVYSAIYTRPHVRFRLRDTVRAFLLC
jgi:hypothetical protein